MNKEKADQLREKIMLEAREQKLPCKQAFAIASETGLPVSEVGKVCNETGIKIVSCQLGCF